MLLNPMLVNNKSHLILDIILVEDIDLARTPESWLGKGEDVNH